MPKRPKMQVVIDLRPGGAKSYKIVTSSPTDTDFAEACLKKVRDQIELLESALHRAYEELSETEESVIKD